MSKKILTTGGIVLFSAIWFLAALFLFLPKRNERMLKMEEEAAEKILPVYDSVIDAGDAGARVSDCIEDMQQIITEFEIPRQNIVTASLVKVRELYKEGAFAGLVVVCSHGTSRGDMFYVAVALEEDGTIYDIAVLPSSRISGSGGSVLSEVFLSQMTGKKADHFGFQTSKIADSDTIIITADDIPGTEAMVSCVNLSLFCFDCYYNENKEDGFYGE